MAAKCASADCFPSIVAAEKQTKSTEGIIYECEFTYQSISCSLCSHLTEGFPVYRKRSDHQKLQIRHETDQTNLNYSYRFVCKCTLIKTLANSPWLEKKHKG